MIALSNATLLHLPASVAVPRYNRGALRIGIVHIGVGNFHRTHQALYVDACLHDPNCVSWGICGVGLSDGPAARAKAATYAAQDGLYTVSEFSPEGEASTRVVGAMVAYLYAPSDPEAVLARLAHPDTRVVTLTITEGGYNLDEGTGEFMLDTPDVAHDLAGGPPRSAFGFLVEGLARRRAAGLPAFAIASCDNLRDNGDTTRRAVEAFARARDPELLAWIAREVDFPNSMVDRIAPQVPEAERERLNAHSGVDDLLPAKAESYSRWVIEDRFRNGRPPLEVVGVSFSDDVSAHVAVKGRMINACHMLLAYPALLVGQRLVHEGMRDPRLVALLSTFLARDVVPFLNPPPDVDLTSYPAMIIGRFSNSAIGDQLLRVAGDGAAKLPIFHGKTIATLLAAEADLGREAFLLACYGRYLDGHDDRGAAFSVFEPGLTTQDWAAIRAEPAGVLRTRPFAGLGLVDHPAFRPAFDLAAAGIARDGVSAALDALVR